MKIFKITPQGYCGGVKYALKQIKNAIENPDTPRPIYLLGPIIHNYHVNQKLKENGIIILNGDSRINLLNKINSGSVVISAHGVSDDVYKKAEDLNLNIIDTTCPNVKIIHNNIKKHLDTHQVLYIGKKGHPECEGVLGLSNKIILVENIADLDQLNPNLQNVYVTNQTTLSIYDLKEIYDKITSLYPYAIIDNKICDATTKRQLALINQPQSDLCLIVGDKSSSNSNKLREISENVRKIKTYLIDDYKSIKDEWLTNVETVSISAGASTPEYLIDEVIEYLKNK